MAFTITWDESDLGSQYQDDIDDLIENTRKGTRERANVEHYAYADETGYADVWRHRKESGRCNYGLAANKPATVAAGMIDGAIYHETDTGLVVKYDAAEAEWVTIAVALHSLITTTYATGTISLTNGSAAIVGAATAWVDGGIVAGDVLLAPDGLYYGVSAVTDNTHITLDRVYAGTNANGQSYTLYLNGHPQYLPKSGGTVNGALTVSGVLTLAAALAAGGQKITGLANGTAATDAAAYGQVGVTAFKTGVYTGDGNATQAITGTGIDLSGAGTPWRIEIHAHVASGVGFWVKTNKNSGAQAMYHSAALDAWTTGMIVSGDADGFTVGNTNHANDAGVVYQYSILKGQ